LSHCDDYSLISDGLNEILARACVIYKDYNLPNDKYAELDWDLLDYAHLRNESPEEFSILVANDFKELFIKDNQYSD
jgi:hypothetical protein